MHRFKFLLFLFLPLSLFSQIRPLTYFSQVSFGGPLYTEIGEGIIATGYINNDSIADIAYTADRTFQIGYGRIENGALFFDMQAVDYTDIERFSAGQIVDVNNDGKADFSMQSSLWGQPVDYETYVFDNQSDTIQTISNPPPIIFPQDKHLFFGKFNEDNKADAYYREGSEMIIMGGATGQVRKPFPATLSSTQSSQIDVNRDGMLDILSQVETSSNSDSIIHEVYLNEGDFVFQTYGTRGFCQLTDYGDFDGDGNIDILDGWNFPTYRIKTNLLSADSADVYEFSINAMSFNPEVFTYDLNKDGFDDIMVLTEDSVFFCKNNQDNTFEIFSTPFNNANQFRFTSHPSWPRGTLLGEIAAVPVMFYFEFEGTTFSITRSSARINPPVLLDPTTSHRIAMIDSDMDGHLELAVSAEAEVVAAEFAGNEFHEYTAHPLRQSTLQSTPTVASEDFNNDGILDIVYVEPNPPAKIQVQFGLPDSTFSSPITLANDYRLCFKLAAADFDGNGFMDIAASAKLNDNFSIFLNQDGSQFIEKQLFTVESEVWNIIDPNQNGVPDLAVSNPNLTTIYMNDGSANFDSTQILGGSVLRSSLVNSKYIATTTGRLYEIDSTGTEKTLIASTHQGLNSRTAYILDYNLDGLPDFLYNKYNSTFSSAPDTSYLVLADTINPTERRIFPNRYVQGVTDVDGDGTEDVLWHIGSQLFVEIINTPTWSDITEQKSEPLQIFPNPCVHMLQFEVPQNEEVESIQVWDATGRLILEKNQSSTSLNVQNLHSGSYFLIVKSERGLVLGSSFLKL